MSEAAPASSGLRDASIGESTIGEVFGEEGRLIYRGYDIKDLAEHSTFPEVAYLLWNERLPNRRELDELNARFTRYATLPGEIVSLMKSYPRMATPMEVLRTTVSALGHYDEDSGNTGIDAVKRKAIRLTARIAAIVAASCRFKQGLPILEPEDDLSLAGNFLYMLSGKAPDPESERAMDVALILHAEHQLNASTFAARVVAATLADMYSSVTAAIGALKGPLHGGANEEVMKMLLEIGEPARAADAIRDRVARKVKVPGFGHAVYRAEDPRAAVLREYSRRLGEKSGQTKWYAISQVVERTMRELMDAKGKPIYPNVDFYSASLYYVMGIPLEYYTPIFAMSRITGWTAHILEQWKNNKLIRPTATYIGPLRQTYVPIDKR
jgi:citrate synthase